MNIQQEIKRITKNNDVKTFMETEIKNIQFRLSVLYAGLISDVSTPEVNRWIKNMNEDILSPRNPVDALFIYTYEKYKDVSSRLDNFKRLFNIYVSEFKDISDNAIKPIDTFGDLYNSICNDSNIAEDGSFETISYTNQILWPKLKECIESDYNDSFVFFLEFLKNDESVQSYQRKSVYYLRRFLYEILTDGIDLLFDRGCYKNTLKENMIIRRATLGAGEDAKHEQFNRFINNNNICLDKIKSYKNKLEEDSLLKHLPYKYDEDNDTDEIGNTYENILQYLKNKRISYKSLWNAFSDYFGKIDTQSQKFAMAIEILKAHVEDDGYYSINKLAPIEKKYYDVLRQVFVELPELKDSETFDPNKITSKETKQYLIDQYCIYALDEEMEEEKKLQSSHPDLMMDIISGKRNVSRSMLVLMAVFAGRSIDEINTVLNKCGFDMLSAIKFDNWVIDICKNNYFQSRKSLYNNPHLLKRDNGSMTREKALIKVNLENKYFYRTLLANLFFDEENEIILENTHTIFTNDGKKNILTDERTKIKKILKDN